MLDENILSVLVMLDKVAPEEVSREVLAPGIVPLLNDHEKKVLTRSLSRYLKRDDGSDSSLLRLLKGMEPEEDEVVEHVDTSLKANIQALQKFLAGTETWDTFISGRGRNSWDFSKALDAMPEQFGLAASRGLPAFLLVESIMTYVSTLCEGKYTEAAQEAASMVIAAKPYVGLIPDADLVDVMVQGGSSSGAIGGLLLLQNMNLLTGVLDAEMDELDLTWLAFLRGHDDPNFGNVLVNSMGWLVSAYFPYFQLRGYLGNKPYDTSTTAFGQKILIDVLNVLTAGYCVEDLSQLPDPARISLEEAVAIAGLLTAAGEYVSAPESERGSYCAALEFLVQLTRYGPEELTGESEEKVLRALLDVADPGVVTELMHNPVVKIGEVVGLLQTGRGRFRLDLATREDYATIVLNAPWLQVTENLTYQFTNRYHQRTLELVWDVLGEELQKSNGIAYLLTFKDFPGTLSDLKRLLNRVENLG